MFALNNERVLTYLCGNIIQCPWGCMIKSYWGNRDMLVFIMVYVGLQIEGHVCT